MKLSPKTRVGELLDAYPFLLDFLPDYNKHFEKLLNPVARATIAKVATLEMAAQNNNLDLKRFLEDLRTAILENTGEELVIMFDEELRARAKKIKSILAELHEKGPSSRESLERRFAEEIKDITPGEIGEIEQELVREGMTPEDITSMCDLHVAVMRSGLESSPDMPAGHPVHTARLENREFEKLARTLSGLARELGKASLKEKAPALEKTLSSLSLVEKHYLRKEHELFPRLEKHGVTAPPQVMWAVHDQVRALLKETKGLLEKTSVKEFSEKARKLSATVLDMVYKEEQILFPMALEHLSSQEWLEIKRGEDEIGYSLVTPGADWNPQTSPEPGAQDGSIKKDLGEQGETMELNEFAENLKKNARLPLSVGGLTLEQIDLMLKNLPVDISFVDEHDELRYYSDTPERIFTRTPGVIGRKVQNCHPPKSVHVVQKIIDEFRKGTKDVAEFWIELSGKFIHIRYFAMRDSNGRYRGTLEVSQDVTGIRKLEGQKRLLDWKE